MMFRLCLIGLFGLCVSTATAQKYPGDALVAKYFQQQVQEISEQHSPLGPWEVWQQKRPEFREQLAEMLGLKPWPEKTDLKATITGKVETEAYTVEKIHFQSRPGLYVTGNLYVPKDLQEKAPGILYVCGHARKVIDGVSYGNKVSYRHHPDWFARNGYVCLIIDTLQLGEIQGTHHGTYGVRHDGEWEHHWWWAARGYTPAGVEAWNGIRALDYLESRPEVDGSRLGVTGRSGGGAYSWWVSTLDERIKCAVPVAGITDLENHVVDGVIAGHCDCMYPVNTHRWDFAQLAAMVAPRPLLLSNTDQDGIFPLDGVYRIQREVRPLYKSAGVGEKFGFHITAGGHKDTQELRVHAFRWMNRHLKDTDDPISLFKPFDLTPEDMKVFDEIPEDQLNTSIHESFVPKAQPKLPTDGTEWTAMKEKWAEQLKAKVFGGWPLEPEALDVNEVFSVSQDGVQFTAYDFISESPFRLRLYLMHGAKVKPQDLDLLVLNVLDQQDWEEFLAMAQVGFPQVLNQFDLPEADKAEFEGQKKMFANFPWAMAYVAPRGVGPTAWKPNERNETHIRRRFHLLGQTWQGMQVWDTRRAIQTLESLSAYKEVPVWVQAERETAGVALYASLFEPDVRRLDLWYLPKSHRDGPIFLNVLKYLDIPQAVAMAADRSKVILYQDQQGGWSYPQKVLETLGTSQKQLQLRKVPQVSKETEPE